MVTKNIIDVWADDFLNRVNENRKENHQIKGTNLHTQLFKGNVVWNHYWLLIHHKVCAQWVYKTLKNGNTNRDVFCERTIIFPKPSLVITFEMKQRKEKRTTGVLIPPNAALTPPRFRRRSHKLTKQEQILIIVGDKLILK